MSRIRLRDIVLDGPIPLKAPFYNFIYFFIFSLITSSCIFLGLINKPYLIDLTNEHLAPKNILLMYHIVIASVAAHSIFCFPYKSHDSWFLKAFFLYPANLWLSLLSAASAIVVSTSIAWFTFGSRELPDNIAEGELVITAIFYFFAWPLASVFVAFLLLPKSYVDSNQFLKEKIVKSLVIMFFSFFVLTAALRAYLALYS